MRVPRTPPNLKNFFSARPAALFSLVDPKVQEVVRSANDKCLHWDKFRHYSMPEGVDPKLAWAAVDLSRGVLRRKLSLTFEGGESLTYWIPPQHHEWLSVMDQKAGGSIGGRYPHSIPDDNERYLFNALMEEAIASSQLEGAATTREIAKEMLRTERRPRTKAERMIRNNYQAILEIRDLKDEQLTPEMLKRLQEILTDGTLEDPQEVGRFRLPHESVRVVDHYGEVMHTPPPAEEVEGRIHEVCAFANMKSSPFVHPVVKGMALHFAIGFIHPFVDGNGRTARAVFYWYMLNQGYWLFEYLPISRIINRSPSKYGTAFLYTETDKGDLTYFNHYHLKVVIRAIEDLYGYIESQQRKLNEAAKLLDDHPDINHRQRALIHDALRHPSNRYTAREHQGKYRVSYPTARADLLGLEAAGLLRKAKRGKEWVFWPAHDLMEQINTTEKAGRPAARRSSNSARASRKTSPEQKGLFD